MQHIAVLGAEGKPLYNPAAINVFSPLNGYSVYFLHVLFCPLCFDCAHLFFEEVNRILIDEAPEMQKAMIDQLLMNDIARIKIRTAQPLAFDSYRKNRITGSIILVDEGTNETVAAGMIV